MSAGPTALSSSSSSSSSSRAASTASVDRYRFVGPIYEAMTWLASGSAIARCRLHAVATVTPGQRVLVVGAGHGADAIAAVDAGAEVTVVERSPTMLAQLHKRAGSRALRLLCADAFDHHERYDLVVANFFLNVFAHDDEARMRRHLISCVGPGGRLAIGDFAHVHAGPLRVVATAHWYLALGVFCVLSKNAVHAQSDHARHIVGDGLPLLDDQRFSVLGLPLYASQLFGADRG